ncbi:MAG: Mov34/MPN/PAD-1 family protein [Candidatus Tectomicrobia bacterium]
MHLITDYQLILDLLTPEGQELGRTPVQVLERYVEDARFSGICTHSLPPLCIAKAATLVPLWRQAEIDPSLLGFRLDLDCDCDGTSHTFSKSYGLTALQRPVQHATASLRDKGQLRLEESVQYRLCAFHTQPLPTNDHALQGTPEVIPYPLQQQSLPALLPLDVSADQLMTSSFSVLLCEHARRDLEQETLRSIEAGTEQAGMLVGHLNHDPHRQHVFLTITAQVLADTQVERQAMAFHFHAETFLAARDVIRLRGQGEHIIGWWHSHPTCQACLQSKDCTVNTLFFSEQDCLVHEAAFNQPYMVAVVTGKASERQAREPALQMYGWQDGCIVQRDYLCIPSSA